MDPIETLIMWMIGFILSVSPINPQYETELQQRDRAEEIARDIVSVTYDEAETPVFFSKSARRLSTMVVLEICRHESAFQYHVDKNIGKLARGDRGRSYCMMQINVGKGRTAEGWTGDELIQDRKKCIRSGYRIIRRSFGACRKYGQQFGLSAYASGSCHKARKSSTRMINRTYRWFSMSPKILDEEILKSQDR